MKRFICLILALIMTALPLASCGGTPSTGGDGTGNGASDAETGGSGDDSDKNGDGLIHGSAPENIGEFARGNGFFFPYAWGDFVFQSDAYEPNEDGYIDYIVFHDMDDPSGGWLPLCCDLARGESSDKFDARISSAQLIVDEAAAVKNGGVPVFIIAYTVERTEKINSHNKEYETKVASFDMKSRKLTILKDGLNDVYIGAICIYRSTLYFATQLGYALSGDNLVYIINKIDLDGSEYAVLENEQQVEWIELDYIADDVIYYSRGGKIYSSALDFSGFTYLFDGYRVCYSDSEYVYYLTAEDLTMTDYDTAFSLCRRKLGDPLSEAETVLSSDVLTGRDWSNYYRGEDGDFYYKVVSPNDGTTVFYSYNCRTGDHKKIFTAEHPHFSIAFATDDRIILQDWDGVLYFIKKETGEYTTIVRWHNA